MENETNHSSPLKRIVATLILPLAVTGTLWGLADLNVKRQDERETKKAAIENIRNLDGYVQKALENAGGNYGVVKNWFNSYTFGGDMPDYPASMHTEISVSSNVKNGFDSFREGPNLIVRVSPDVVKSLETKLIKAHADSFIDTGASFP